MKITFDSTKLKAQIEENPLVAAGVASSLLFGGAKMLDALTNMRNSKTHRREVKRREKKDRNS